MEGLIISIVTLLAFVVMGVYIVVSVVKGPKLPKGHKFEEVYEGNKAIVIVDDEVTGKIKNQNEQVVSWLVDGNFIYGKDIAKKCAIAMHATEFSFQKNKIQNADEPQVVFHFTTNESFDKNPLVKNAAAYSMILSGMFAIKKTPIAIIRADYLKHVSNEGQPVIHELVHILNKAAKGNFSHNHSDPNLWIGPGGEKSVEANSVKKWKELLEKI